MSKNAKVEIILAARDVSLSSGINKATKGLERLKGEAEGLRAKLSGLSATTLAIGGIAGGAAIYYANEVRKIADEYTNLNSRLKLVTEGERELTAVREQLYRISNETGTEYAGNADSYAKLARAVKDLGGNSSDTLQIVEMVNKSLTINGSNTSMAAAFMQQFAQAMGSGVLQGDEFRSMLENNGYFAAQLAKAVGVNIAGLREMATKGELTASKLRAAFPKMAQDINGEFGKIAPTVERAMAMLDNSFKRIVDESNRASGGTGTISQSIINLAETIDRNRDGIISLFTKMIDLGAWTTKQVAGMGTEIEVLGQVAKGNLGFFDYIKMTSLEEMNEWLKKNVQVLNETGPAAQKAGNEIVNAAQKSASSQEKVTGDALKEMKKQYQDYANTIRKLQDDISGRERSLAAELRSLGRTGMTDAQAWDDQKREAQEYETAARQAAEAAKAAFKDNPVGAVAQWKTALEYADQAKQAYAGLNTEVKNGENVVVSQQEALKIAMAGVRGSGELAISILKQQQAATAGAMNSLNEKSGFANLAAGMTAAEQQWLSSWENMKNAAGEKITLVKQQIDSMGTNVDHVQEKMKTAFSDMFQPPEDGDWGKVWEAMESGSKQSAESVTSDWDRVWDAWLASGSDDIKRLQEQLSELIKDRHMKVYVETVQKNRWGGIIGAYQTGGHVSKFARGGKLPGYGGGDRVRALLEPGEFVIRKEAVSHYGVALMQSLNSMRLDKIDTIRARLGGLIAQAAPTEEQRFQHGGLAVSGESKGTINVNMTFPGGSQAVPMKLDKGHVRQLLSEINRMNWRASS